MSITFVSHEFNTPGTFKNFEEFLKAPGIELWKTRPQQPLRRTNIFNEL